MASLTVIGEVDSGRAVLRSGARPGDLLGVSCKLGEAAELGLRLVLKGFAHQRAVEEIRLSRSTFTPSRDWPLATGSRRAGLRRR